MNEKQRTAINRKMDRLLLTLRRKTSWGKGFVIPPKNTDIQCVESFRFERVVMAKDRLKK